MQRRRPALLLLLRPRTTPVKLIPKAGDALILMRTPGRRRVLCSVRGRTRLRRRASGACYDAQLIAEDDGWRTT